MDEQKLLKLKTDFPWLAHLEFVAADLLRTLYDKESTYRGSWQKRGGVGAFMMLARKWDRIEAQAEGRGYDIFRMLRNDEGELDDIQDLVAYLLLVLAEHRNRSGESPF